jgi:hypothetical protein
LVDFFRAVVGYFLRLPAQCRFRVSQFCFFHTA